MEVKNVSRISNGMYATYLQTDNYTPSVYGQGVVNTLNTREGYINPHWRAQVRAHTGATTPMTGQSRSFDPGYYLIQARAIHVTVPGFSYNQQAYGSFLPVRTPDSLNSDVTLPGVGLDNLALTRFYANCHHTINSLNVGSILAELRETIKGLKHPLNTLVRGLEKREIRLHKKLRNVRNLRRVYEHNNVRGRDVKNMITDSWLETQFALKPVIADVVAIAEFVRDYPDLAGIRYYRVKGSAKTVSVSYEGPNLLEPRPANIAGYAYREKKVQKTVRYKGELSVTPLRDDGNILWNHRRLGLDFEEFIPTLYQVTPWSFLLDYVSNFGDVLESFSVPLSSVTWINKTVRSEASVEVTRLDVPQKTVPGSGYTYVCTAAEVLTPAKTKRKVVVRTKIQPFLLPRPSIQLDLPRAKQFVNMVALAASSSRKRFNHSR